MITTARARIDVGAVRHLSSRPPWTLREVRSDEPGGFAVCLVGSAAGPLPGDDLALEFEVGPGAVAVLCASAATLAQGGGGASSLRTTVGVGAGARLRADPGALIVCAGAAVRVALRIDLAADATLDWTETVVLGRHGEAGGAAVLDWDVRRAGAPVLRQTVDLADPVLRAWPGMLGGARTMTTRLRVGPDVDARTVVHARTHVTQRLADHATLETRLSS